MRRVKTKAAITRFILNRWIAIKKKKDQVSMPKEEFYEFCYQNRAKLFRIQKQGRLPKILLKDEFGKYTPDNLKITSWNNNNKKAMRDSPSKKVGTLENFKTRRWDKMVARCKPNHNARKYYFDKGIKVEITKKDFRIFCDKNWDLIQKIYKDGETPSIDRINPNKSYTLENIQILSMRENNHRSRNITKSQPIWAQNMITNEVTLLEDGRLGKKSREMGFNPQRVLLVLQKKWHTYKDHYFTLAGKLVDNGSHSEPCGTLRI